MQTGASMQLVKGSTVVVCSDSMRKLLAMVERVARHDAAVLVVGETGSGKELIARAIHHHSLRAGKSFVDVNCAALPEHLVESELFGYEKGAFSGADSTKPGLFELADQGTLFLDEIGELDPRVQAKLLRVLDGVPFYRLGGSRKVEVNVRVIAATNRLLENDVRDGKFRRDLFHRLTQFQLQVPALRDRPDDIEALAQHFVEQQAPGVSLTPDARRHLLGYAWPGNVRELRNVIFKTAIHLAPGSKQIRARDLPPEICGQAPEASGQALEGNLEEMEKRMILQAMSRTGGACAEAAQQLGISERTLRRKLDKYRREASSETSTLGAMGAHQQRYFRVSVQIPVVLTVDGAIHQGTISNISSGGLAIQSSAPLAHGAIIEASFTLPGQTSAIEGKTRLAWAAPGGLAGLSFVELHPVIEQDLQRWLLEQARSEGWTGAGPEV